MKRITQQTTTTTQASGWQMRQNNLAIYYLFYWHWDFSSSSSSSLSTQQRRHFASVCLFVYLFIYLFICIVVVSMRVQSHPVHIRSVLLVLLLISFCGPGNDAAKASSRRSRGRGKNLLPFANVAEHSLLSQTADQERSVKIIKASHFNQAYRLGGKIVILCTASGYPRPTITWYKDGVELVFKNNVHVQEQNDDEQKQTSRIEIDPATMGDQGIYTCLAHNERDVDQRTSADVGPEHPRNLGRLTTVCWTRRSRMMTVGCQWLLPVTVVELGLAAPEQAVGDQGGQQDQENARTSAEQIAVPFYPTLGREFDQMAELGFAVHADKREPTQTATPFDRRAVVEAEHVVALFAVEIRPTLADVVAAVFDQLTIGAEFFAQGAEPRLRAHAPQVDAERPVTTVPTFGQIATVAVQVVHTVRTFAPDPELAGLLRLFGRQQRQRDVVIAGVGFAGVETPVGIDALYCPLLDRTGDLLVRLRVAVLAAGDDERTQHVIVGCFFRTFIRYKRSR
ncbi:Vascular endothelial growth factor receptor 2 [Trichinella britovi]|uniref:Vascular endothelial growth factor receptor 2 n=1 Tax=Trichinella britovi TaxID=45882 RepID=A0A0V1CUG0_TRIBR|nr:Vascular endothelial growth factor receptor 2 [Trichinella britovi]